MTVKDHATACNEPPKMVFGVRKALPQLLTATFPKGLPFADMSSADYKKYISGYTVGAKANHFVPDPPTVAGWP